ncbi:alpha/beta hydrolase [Reichenbachiella sp.]
MKNYLSIVFMFLLTQISFSQSLQEVQFLTSDKVEIFGDLYYDSSEQPLIILFHQAGSCAQGEYANVIPTLLKNGFNVLAIDQRSGGEKLGGKNRTVEGLKGKKFEYCDTYPDFVAALAYATKDLNHLGSIIVWGSSYSAAMVIHLAAEFQDQIAGVLAFSPASGGPMKPCSPNDKFEQIAGRGMILRPAKEMEIPSVTSQFELAEKAGMSTFIAQNGVHGSSMLNPEKVDGSVEDTWKAVFDFIAGL